MTEPEDNLWAGRDRGRHADLYDAEYAKQLERIARIRSEVSASLEGRDTAGRRDEATGARGGAADARGAGGTPGAGGAREGARGGADTARGGRSGTPGVGGAREAAPGARGGAAGARGGAAGARGGAGTARGGSADTTGARDGAGTARGGRAGAGGRAAASSRDRVPGGTRRDAAGGEDDAAARRMWAATHDDARLRDGARRPPLALSVARWDAAPVDLAPELGAPVAPRVASAAAAAVAPAVLRRALEAGGAGEAYDTGRPRVVVMPDDAPGRDRRPWVVAGALVLALIAAVAAVVLAAREPESAAATVFRVPGQPTGLVADAGRVWVAGPAAGEVWVLDQVSGRLVAPALEIGGTPARVALDPQFAWIADTERSSVVRAPRTGGGELREFRTGPDLADVTVAGGRVWTASSADGTVRALDARGRREVLRVGVRPIALAGDARRVVALDAIGALVRIDATARREQGPPVQLGGEPVDVALAGDVAWVADAGAGTVRAVRLTTGAAGPPIAVGAGPVAIAADARDVYVLCRTARTLVRLGPDGSVRSRLKLENAPTAMALDSRHVWIAAGTNEVIRVDR